MGQMDRQGMNRADPPSGSIHHADPARANQALQETIDALAEVTDFDQYVPRVLDIIARTFGSRSCAAYENDPAGKIWLRFWSMDGRMLLPSDLLDLDPAKFAVVRQLVEGFEVPDNYLGAPSANLIGPVILDHATGTSIPIFDQFAVGNNWHWELNIGIGSGGSRTATLCIFREHAQPFTTAEIILGESLAKQLGVAIRTARLAAQAQEAAVERVREIQARRLNDFLVRTVEGLSNGSDIRQALQALVTELARTVQAAHLFLFRHNAAARSLTLELSFVEGRVRWGPCGDEMPLFGSTFPDDITPAWHLMCQHRILFTPQNTVLSPEEFAWPGAFDYARRFELSDIAHTVLFSGSVPLGSLGFGFRGGTKLRAEDRPFIEAAARQAAIVIRMLDLSEDVKAAAIANERQRAAEDRAAELAKTKDALRRTLDAVAAEPLLERIPSRVLSAITTHLQSTSSALWLLDPKSGRFHAHLIFHEGSVLDLHADSNPAVAQLWGRGRDLALKRHIESQRPTVYQTDELKSTNGKAFSFLQSIGVHTLLGIPLILGGEIYGSLTIRFHQRRELSPEDLELAQAMSHQATLAIQLTRLAALAGETALAAERGRFAREIHDTLAQGFTGILMQLGAASLVPGDRRSDIAPHIHAVTDLARFSLAEARRSVRALRPLAVQELRLEQVVEQLAGGIRLQTNAEVTVRIQGEAGKLAPHVETELCRIVQESLNNVVKHASAKFISVHVEFQHPDSIRISIRDDGVGFDPAVRTHPDRFGILGMQERAASIGASLTIISEVGRGTQIVVQYTKGRG